MSPIKKQIIVLQGQDKTGKTETLKILIQKLLSVSTKVADEGKFDSRMRNKHWDVWAIFEYQGRYIAITTRGDEVRFINNDVIDMESEARNQGFEIDTYVCATHTYGETVSYVENKAKLLKAELHFYGKATYTCPVSPNEKVLQTQINDWQAGIVFANL